MITYLKTIRGELIEYNRNPNQYKIYPVKYLDTAVNLDSKWITYRAMVNGSTDNYADYIQFYNLEFAEHKEGKFVVPFKSEGRLMFYSKPSMKENPVFLRCSCPDFQHRFAWPLARQEALLGDPIPYKGYPTDRPVNPKQLMGFCKHLWSMLKSLKDSDFITE